MTAGPQGAADPDRDAAWRELLAEVADLRAEVAALRARLDAPGTGAGEPRAAGSEGAGPPASSGPGRVSRRGLVLGAVGAGAAVAAGQAVVAAGPAGAAPLVDGATDLGERLVEWTSANPVATVQLRNRGGGTPLMVSATGDASPGVRVEQASPAQPALTVRHSGGARGGTGSGTAPALDVASTNQGNGISAQGLVVGVFGAGDIYGVEGQSFHPQGVGMAAGGPKAALRLKPSGGAPAERDGPYFGGEVVVDRELTVWVCVEPGRPGRWRELASATGAGGLHLLDPPERVYDSRPVGPILSPGEARTIPRPDAVPAHATAVVVGVTSTASTGAGLLSVYAAGHSWPGTTSLSFSGMDVTATSLSALGPAGLAVRVEGAATHVAVDLYGWYA